VIDKATDLLSVLFCFLFSSISKVEVDILFL
jgi:hypothetical protein